MGIPVKLQVFEGPLDLLLHLIDKNKINIYDIPISEITNQYLYYIKQMQKNDMDLCSEFLLMAATLLEIKAKMLLPAEINEEGEEEDPRQELVQQLLEYKMYKYMSYELKDRLQDSQRMFFHEQSIPDEIKNYEEPINVEELIGDLNLTKLYAIFQSIVRKQEDRIDPVRSKFKKIEKEEIHLENKMEYITDYIKKNKKCSFSKLLLKQSSKIEVIVTFLAILEMMKEGKVLIIQENLFDDFTITANINE